MSVYHGDEYWARYAERFVRINATTYRPCQVLAEELGLNPKSVSTTVSRLRERGFLTWPERKKDKAELTPKAEALLELIHLREESSIAFEVAIYAKSKAEALAEVWDVVVQLENWDPAKGPFELQPARLRNLGKATDGGV